MTDQTFLNLRYKSLKWWAQSFLVGIQTIVCGYRDDNGIVGRLGAIDVNQLRKDCDVSLFQINSSFIHNANGLDNRNTGKQTFV